MMAPLMRHACKDIPVKSRFDEFDRQRSTEVMSIICEELNENDEEYNWE
jgi:hypothetical protein